MEQPSKKKQSGALLFLMGSSFFVALVVVVGMVLIFSPAGSKRLGALLISPRDLPSKTTIEFVVFEPDKSAFTRWNVEQKNYEEFFLEYSHLRSETTITDEMVRLFATRHPSTLTIKTNGDLWQLQMVADSEIFRLLPPLGRQWYYFSSPDILYHAIQLLTQ